MPRKKKEVMGEHEEQEIVPENITEESHQEIPVTLNQAEITAEENRDQEELAKAREQLQKSQDGLVRDTVGKTIQGIVNESRLPSENYESTVGVYGGKMVTKEDGKLVWDRRGIVSQVDKAGDAILRSYDEHTVAEPLKMLFRRPGLFFKKLFNPGTKRYRGNNEEILENIERLGLSEYYGENPDGIEIKNPEIYTKGIALQDVLRADIIGSDELKSIDRFDAIGKAASYISSMHQEHGAIGEVLVSDIIFQENEDGNLEKPVLNLPDIVFNKDKKETTGEVDKKATDLLDFLASVFSEEYRRGEVEEIESDKHLAQALDAVLENYQDENIVALVKSFAKRGRLTLQGDGEFFKSLDKNISRAGRGLFSQHNKARLASKKEIEAVMKDKIIEACDRFFEKRQEGEEE